MKKILFLLTLILVGSFSVVNAESVKIEAENYTSVNFVGGYSLGNQNFSNKNAFYSYISAVDKRDCTIEYTVTAEKDGVYNMSGVTSLCYADYTTSFYVRVNGDEIMYPANNVIQRYNYAVSGRTDYMALQDFGNIYLNKGENKIEIIYHNDDAHIADPYYIVILDYFEFTHTEETFAIKSISGLTKAANVFLKSQSDVAFDIYFTTTTNKKTYIPFTVTDVKGKVKNGKIMLAKGQRKYRLNLGPMLAGWYKLTFSGIDTGDVINPVLFSVLPGGIKADNCFGIDTFGVNLKTLEKLYNAVGMAGLSNIRINTDPKSGQNKNYFETHEDIIREKEGDAGLRAMQVYEHLGVNYSRKAPDNLLEAYEINRNFAEHYKGQRYYYEIWNEQDAQFFSQPADIFSAFFKVAAIGISDGDSDALKMPGGYGAAPETLFTRLSLRNGITDYADIYAYHNHSTADKGKSYNRFIESVARKHTETALAYDPTQQIWVTEAGLSMPVSENNVPNDETLISQARYYIISTVEQLAYGADKSFWFRLEHYMESGREWGSFNASNQPYPVINSIRILTDKLKTSEYKGSIDTDEDVLGYMFNNGENDVAVIWSDYDKRCQLYTDYNVTVTDMFGKKKEYTPCDVSSGKMINIPVSYYPVFVEFNGLSDSRNYFENYALKKETKAKIYKEADRIIIDQRWEGQDEYASKQTGYSLNDGDTQKVYVYVYNLNDTAKSGSIEISNGSAVRDAVILKSEQTSFDFTVEPMSRQCFEIEISLNETAQAQELGFLKISGVLDTGEKISESISAFYKTGEREMVGAEVFDDYDNIDNWRLSNHGSGLTVKATAPQDGVVRFDVSSKNSNTYYWPTYTVKKYVTDEDGISFWIRSTKGNEQNVNVYAYATDGSYWLGYAYAISYGVEWKQICIPWHKFVTFQSSDYQGAFDPSKIRNIGIGSYAPAGETSYEIKNLGWYTSENASDKPDSGEPVRIKGIEEGKTYPKSRIFNISANVDTNTDIKVRLGDKYINDYTLSDGKISFSFEVENSGEYDLQIICTDKWNYKNSSMVKFKVR